MSGAPVAPHGETAGAGLPRVFVGEGRRRLDAVIAKYPAKAGALLPALWMVQEAHGWISPAGMAEVAEVLELTPAYVRGVVTFYTMYHRHPTGKHVLMMCTNVSCMIRGGYDVMHALEKKLGIKAGENSADGEFTLVEEECLAACADAPMAICGRKYYLRLDGKQVDAMLDELRRGAASGDGSHE